MWHYHKLTPYTVSKDKINGTQRRTQVLYVHEVCIVCTAVCQKALVWLKPATSNSEKIKPIVLAVTVSCISWAINQAVSRKF